MVEYELEPYEPEYELEPIDDEPWYKKAAGVGEAALSAASGMLSWIPGGVVKAAGLVSGQLKEGSELGEAVQHALTYEPRTETGKTMAGYVAKPFEWISEKAQEAGDWTYEKTGSPLLGAAARTAVESIPFVAPVAAVKGLKRIKGKPRESYGPIEETPPEFLREAPVEAAKEVIPERPIPEEIIPERPIPVEEVKLAPERIETKQYVLEPEPVEILKEPLIEPVIKPETLEVMVKGGSTGELPKYAEGSSINLERLDTTQDIKQFQNILTKAAEEKIGKRQVSWEETTKAAEDLAWDDKEFLKQAKKKGGFSAAEIDAMRQINTNALHDLFNTIQEMPADYMKRTPESRLAVLDKLNNYVEVMKETSRKSSEAGRALNIHKKMIQDNPEFTESAYRKQVLQQMMDALGGREMTDAMIDDLRGVDFKDPKAVRDIIQKYHQSGLFDKIYEVWLNSILSAPASHAANILGNTLSLMTKVPESAVKDILSGKSPVGAIRAESVGLWQGMKDGVRAAAKAFQSGVPSDMLTKVEHQRYSAIPGKTGEAVRIPTRALTAADEFFKAIIYRAEANMQAYNITRNEGLSGTPMAERMTKIINDAQDPSFLDVHTKARNESLYRTFNKPLGNMGQGVMRLRDRVPGLRYVIPFIRTPMNIAKFALERTPLNFGKILYEYKTGKLSPSELNAELAKPIVGSLIAAATVMNVLEGNITGAPPKNKKDRDLLYSTGWQPYSLKIGKQYVSYSRLEPVGSLVGVTADFVSAMQDDDSEINARAGNIIMSFSRNIASKTYLQSVSGILDAISDPERYGGSYVEKVAGSVVPSIVAAGARAVDPYVRDVETPLEAIQARIPGLSGNLPVKVGAFEMPIERPGGALSRFLSPVQISEARPDMEIIAGAEINEREMERKLTKLQKKTMRELLRQSRIR